MRVRHKPWALEKLNAHPTYVIQEPETLKGKWSELFQNNHPLHVEIGTGKGQFMTGMAKSHPEVNFIGVEMQGSILVEALDKVLDDSPENLRLLHENAQNLTSLFDEGEVDTIYLNFSDPWPKNRHEKRRLTSSSFLKNYKKVLHPSRGHIELKTDNQGLFEYSLESFSVHGFILKQVSLDLHSKGDVTIIKTEYEEKFSARGQRIFRCEVWLK